jgi:4-amino-4-deoxy-L-arabinose transferase-like glycosyltransferase
MRLVGPLAALGSLLLVARLATRLAPDRPDVARRTGWILLGTGLWALFGTLFMFDTLLALFAVLAWTGVVDASEGHPLRGWALAGAGLGLGILAKGPVIFLHVLPVALLGPWWALAPPRRGRWTAGLLAAVLMGVGIGLAWALPAAAAGGEAYAARILWGQTAGRVAGSFAHARPLWWYLPWLPVAVLPWSLSRRIWSGLFRRARPGGSAAGGPGAGAPGRDSASRFALAVLVPSLVAFSLVSGKQIHYLLPELPLFALLVAARLEADRGPWSAVDRLGPALLFAVLGLVLAAFPWLRETGAFGLDGLPAWTLGIRWWPAALPLVGAALVYRWARGTGALPAVATGTALLLAGVLLAVMPAARSIYDVEPMARRIAVWQAEGRPVAVVGGYHGQYAFAGRLVHTIDEVLPDSARAWAGSHPDGVLIGLHRHWPVPGSGTPIATSPFRGRTAAAWDASTVLQDDPWSDAGS